MAGARLGGLALTLTGALGVTISGWTLIGNSIKAGDGILLGKIIQFERSGAVWETYEGVVALDESGSAQWHFSLDRSRRQDELIATLYECADQQKTVKVKYEQYYAAAPWRGNTNTYVLSVETK